MKGIRNLLRVSEEVGLHERAWCTMPQCLCFLWCKLHHCRRVKRDDNWITQDSRLLRGELCPSNGVQITTTTRGQGTNADPACVTAQKLSPLRRFSSVKSQEVSGAWVAQVDLGGAEMMASEKFSGPLIRLHLPYAFCNRHVEGQSQPQ